MEIGEYHWTVDAYRELVEQTQNPMLKDYQQTEADFIKSVILHPEGKTYVDIGAGYGRTIPLMRPAKKAIAIELDSNLFPELERQSNPYPNIEPVQADANELAEILKDRQVANPVLLCLQNSIGTWKGNYRKILEEMRQVAQSKNGEIVLSLFSQEGLKDEGVPMYKTLVPLVGEYNPEATDTKRGVFRSKSGYKSQWWTPEQRKDIKQFLGGTVSDEKAAKSYDLLHITY